MRFFWPIYLITAAAGTAGVYVAAPLARPYLPDFLKRPPPAVAVREGDGTDGPRLPFTPDPAAPNDRSASAAAPAASDDPPPALLGIFPAQRGEKPGWGVTHQQAAYYSLDGTRSGQVDGGVILDFQNRHTSSKGDMAECLLSAAGVPATPLLVSLADIRLFTGDYRKLSPRQLADLKAYYGLSGKIAQRKKELLQASAQANPFFEAYQAQYKTLMANIEKAKGLAAQRDNATEQERLNLDDALREMKMAESQIRRDYQDLHQKFRDWKEQHADEIPQPQNDPSIQQWSRQRAELIPRVSGLAY